VPGDVAVIETGVLDALGNPVYEYTLQLPEEDWFRQYAGTDYWLSVAALTEEPTGWQWLMSGVPGDSVTMQYVNDAWLCVPVSGNMMFGLAGFPTPPPAIPEPASIALLALGALALANRRRGQ
jgi:hypothetical protein